MVDVHDNRPSASFNTQKLGRAGLAAFLSISEKWDLNTAQQTRLLGDLPESTFFKYKHLVKVKKDFELNKDLLERISYILGIYKALHILLPDDTAANEWIHKINSAPLFNNSTALSKMLAGNVVDLADVRRFLDGQRGSVYF